MELDTELCVAKRIKWKKQKKYPATTTAAAATPFKIFVVVKDENSNVFGAVDAATAAATSTCLC